MAAAEFPEEPGLAWAWQVELEQAKQAAVEVATELCSTAAATAGS